MGLERVGYALGGMATYRLMPFVLGIVGSYPVSTSDRPVDYTSVAPICSSDLVPFSYLQ